MAKDKTNAGGTVKVRLVKGLRGTQSRHRLSVRALGLNKINDVRELKDSPQVRGLINQLHYLVRATIKGLGGMHSPSAIAAKRGKKVEDLQHG